MFGNRYVKKSFELAPASIDRTSEEITELLNAAGIERKILLQIRLGLEEILLRWQDKIAEPCNYDFIVEKRLGKINIRVQLYGVPVNPLKEKDSEEEQLGRNILASLGLDWSYEYRNGVNQVAISLQKPSRLSPCATMLLCMLGGLASGFLLLRMPEAFVTPFTEQFITPIFDTFLGILSAAVGPMLFFSVAYSICSMGDAQVLGSMGKSLFQRWFSYIGIAAVVTVVIGLLLFPVQASADGQTGGQLGTLFSMLLATIPNNFFTPFTEGNTLQIIFLAALTGTLVGLSRHRLPLLDQFLEQSNDFMGQVVGLLGKLTPAFVFISILRIVLLGITVDFNAVSRFLVSIFAPFFLIFILCFVGIAVKEKMSPFLVLKKLAPSVLLGFVTASSSATFPVMRENLKKGLGIDKQLLDFGLPMGIVVFKPTSVVAYIGMSLFCCRLYDVPLTVEAAVLAGVVSILLSVATPPVSGGVIACFTLLFTQLGIPLEALVIAGTLDMAMDFFYTSFNILFLQVQLLHSAKKLGMIDEEVLRSRKV